eukprot:Awhi_evm1s13029
MNSTFASTSTSSSPSVIRNLSVLSPKRLNTLSSQECQSELTNKEKRKSEDDVFRRSGSQRRHSVHILGTENNDSE